jgi:hypothetical protein
MFPDQLADQPLVRVKRRSKEPVIDNYEVEPINSVASWVQLGNNAGICLADSPLVVVDADTTEIATEVYERLPETFTVNTGGSGFGLHYYYECPEWGRNATLKDGDSSVRTNGWMAVIPPSQRESRYTVTRDVPIAKISPGELGGVVDTLTETDSTDTSSPATEDRGRADSGELDELDELIDHDGYRGDVRDVLKDREAEHHRRVWLAGFLHGAVGLSASEIVRLIDRLNQWDNYDRQITEQQVKSVIESSGGGR